MSFRQTLYIGEVTQLKKNFSCSSYGPEIFLNLELLKNEQLLFSEVISQPLAKVI